MTSEKDEVQLRSMFNYKQAFFHKGKALKKLNITDVLWVEANV
jgi:hypothetical protein